MEEKKKSLRGFAAMSPERQREIARKGGESVPNEKRSFSQNPGLAAEAGRKGGQNVNPSKRSFSRTTNWPRRPVARAGMLRTAARRRRARLPVIS